MSETLRPGDAVVVLDPHGNLLTGYGIGWVISSDLSTVVARFGEGDAAETAAVNAGSLRWAQNTIRAATPADVEVFETSRRESKRQELNGRQVSDLQCDTCRFWRPPFDTGPGNCHNQAVMQLTNIGGETYSPPTPAHFGCVQWQSKEQPENGDE